MKHTTKKGIEINIEDMSIQHLNNCIRIKEKDNHTDDEEYKELKRIVNIKENILPLRSKIHGCWETIAYIYNDIEFKSYEKAYKYALNKNK